MLHLTGMLLVFAGASASGLKSPNSGRGLFRRKPKKLYEVLAPPGGVPSFKIPPKSAIRVIPADGKMKFQDRVEDALEKMKSGSKEYSVQHLAASTGAIGLAVGAYFGVLWLTPVSFFVTGILAAPIFAEAIRSTIKERRLKVDVLDSAIISLCLLFGQLFAAALMVWVLDLGEMLLERTTRKSRQYVTDVFGKHIQYAWLLVDDKEIQILVSELQKGDIIVISTGEQVPVDGVVVKGTAMVDQQSLTGEAAPIEKHTGEMVFAMTSLVAGQVHVKVVETGENTVASKIVQIVSDAANYKSKIQSTGERIADQMVLPTLGLGVASFFVSGVGALLATVNADFGTGIRVAAPIALLASLGNAARNGILIKDSSVFELLPNVNVVLFDKTGTLTYDTPVVSRIVPANATIDADRVLFYTAASEQKFTHPIAKAILQKAKSQGMTLPPLDMSHYHVGFGIEVKLDGLDIKVGSSRYMEEASIPMPQTIQDALRESRAQGKSAILTAIDNEVVGLIEMESTPREESIRVINFLKARGITEIVLISGDHEAPTQALAAKLGIELFRAGVLPQEKAQVVQSYRDAGKKVMMVGDGINDSAALSLADVSVSIQGASTIAVDIADVIFMDGSLKRFEYLYLVAEKLQRNVQNSFLMIAVPNIICIAGAMVGVFGLSSSLILNNGFNVLAALNGTLPLVNEEKNAVASEE